MTRRTFAPTFALALVAVTACKGGASDPTKLIPEAATVVVGVDLKGLVGSSPYQDIKPALDATPAKAFMEAAEGCNVGSDKWKNLTMGLDPAANQFAMAIQIDGIGKDENLTCLAGKIKEQSGGKEPWTVEEKDGKKTLALADGAGTGWVINDGALVLASKDWQTAVSDVMAGKGKSVFDGPMKDVIARTDTSKHMWFAGSLSEDMVKGSPAEGAKSVAGSLDFSNGLAVAATVMFANAEDATKKKDELQGQFDQFKGMAVSMMGLPQTLVDSVKIEAKDAIVSVGATASADDLKKLAAKAQGGPGAGAAGAPVEAAPAGDAPAGDAPAGDAPAAEAAPAE